MILSNVEIQAALDAGGTPFENKSQFQGQRLPTGPRP